MKLLILNLSLFLVLNTMVGQSIYDFKVKTLEAEEFDFKQLQGKKVMIVNTASKCGFTPQYANLEKLYTAFKDKNFVIIGFPANNFLSQEPGTNAEIREFCTRNYGVTFPMMEKISVKGKDMHPIYQWLTTKAKNGFADSEVKWNFQKYLIDENGKMVGILSPRDKPDEEKVIGWIKTGNYSN